MWFLAASMAVSVTLASLVLGTVLGARQGLRRGHGKGYLAGYTQGSSDVLDALRRELAVQSKNLLAAQPTASKPAFKS